VKNRQKWKKGQPDEVCRLNPKIQKKYQNTNSTNQDEHFSKKSMLSTLKKKELKTRMRATLNSKSNKKN
jgi:hypothetical protein